MSSGPHASAADPIRTIAVATDFSPAGANVVEHAAELASEREAKLFVVHVTGLKRFGVGPPQPEVLPPHLEGAVREAAEAKLREVALGLAERGLRVETKLEAGDPGSRIVAAAEEAGADLVVVGTMGLSGFKHLLLGSTAESVVRHCPVPVLTIRPDRERGVSDVRVVLVPTDFSEHADHAIDELVRLFGGRNEGVQVVLVHVHHLPVVLEPLFGDLRVVPASFEDIARELRKDMEPAAERLRKAGFEVRTQIHEGDPAPLLTELAAAESADLVAMGTRGRTGLTHLLLGSTAGRVVQHAPCPVLTVRRSD